MTTDAVDLAGLQASVDRACAKIDELRAERDAIRAELQAAREEIERLKVALCDAQSDANYCELSRLRTELQAAKEAWDESERMNDLLNVQNVQLMQGNCEREKGD